MHVVHNWMEGVCFHTTTCPNLPDPSRWYHPHPFTGRNGSIAEMPTKRRETTTTTRTTRIRSDSIHVFGFNTLRERLQQCLIDSPLPLLYHYTTLHYTTPSTILGFIFSIHSFIKNRTSQSASESAFHFPFSIFYHSIRANIPRTGRYLGR